MNVEVSISGVLMTLFSVLLASLAFFVRQWMQRQQLEIDSVKAKHSSLVNDFHAYQLNSATQFAQRAEMHDGRKELLDALANINTKIDRLTDKLDKKADK